MLLDGLCLQHGWHVAEQAGNSKVDLFSDQGSVTNCFLNCTLDNKRINRMTATSASTRADSSTFVQL